MKILMISIFAPHFFNWTEQLRGSGHEIYWLDVFDSNTTVEQIDFVHQIIGWRYKWDFPGRYLVKQYFPRLNKVINFSNERKLQTVLASKLEEIKPDVVHSFVMYIATAPILEVMEKYPTIKWIYSSWGSDLYFYRKRKRELKGMERTLPVVDYMFADCGRDYKLAVENGFKGKFLGVFPGGGGFDLEKFKLDSKGEQERRLIIIKGYQGLHGKCITVLKAVMQLKQDLKNYHIVVFGAPDEVFQFVKDSPLNNFKNFKLFGKLPHEEIIRLMGRSLIYIGNSSSDGMPNTLLEAIIMGVFPIQSNPGGATAEIIDHNMNGFLIQDPEDSDEIVCLLREAVKNQNLRTKAVKWNSEQISPSLEREKVRERVLKAYSKIEKDLE